MTIRSLQSYFFTAKGIVPAVDDVITGVPTGKIIDLVGRSGCGKSMTVMSVMGPLRHLGKAVGGRILLDGRDTIHLGPKERIGVRENEISIIFQESVASLNPAYQVGRRVQEAILLHRKASEGEVKRQVIGIFKEVGIPEPKKRYNPYSRQLFGGLRQHMMIGMAMVCKSKIMIVNRPTTVLDVTIGTQTLWLMKRLRDEQGTSITLITHNMGMIVEVCDYVYVMYTGRVMKQAEVFDSFANMKHPYTQGLLRFIPELDSNEERLCTIEDVVPNMLYLPWERNSYNRCTKAAVRCLREKPQLYDAGADEGRASHKARCFLYDDRSAEGSREAEHGR